MRASDHAHATLRSDIIEWRLVPGDLLAEVEQSARLGVSRTPLREALSRLVAEGLAAPHSGRGVVVSAISLEAVADLFEVRLPLECAAVRLAVARNRPGAFAALAEEFAEAPRLIDGDDDGQEGYYALVSRLDQEIDAAAANPYLLQAQKPIRTHLARVRRLARDNPARLLASAREHEQIALALGAGNADLAEAAMRVHLHNSLHHLLSQPQATPSRTTRATSAAGATATTDTPPLVPNDLKEHHG
ncbi:GntR family transcriptional regulator [Arthrobacter agilis]|uniref:GntR family transcriptional regulator n=1 Tax=Arthrobacter agilis TaxID=37921 RepID=UPI0023673809|nr:GntR family transcriptional regulator [Arthrobacter agilis]WDF34470.1 GntR family transcriptional regulator [Arthrobacter agilis]